MSDSASPTSPTPAAKKPRTNGLLDKRQLAEISGTVALVGVLTSDPALLAKIQDDQVITPAFLATLNQDVQYVTAYTGGTVQAKVGGKITTAAEAVTRSTLVAQIHYIQSKAKVKYPGQEPVLRGYGVGTNINLNRPALEAAASTIIEKLKTDTLPKITAKHATDLQAALEAYRQSQVDQVGKKGDATTLRQQLATLVASLSVRRRQIQHAADGEFPFTDPANAGTRRKFGLPVDQPLKR